MSQKNGNKNDNRNTFKCVWRWSQIERANYEPYKNEFESLYKQSYNN